MTYGDAALQWGMIGLAVGLLVFMGLDEWTRRQQAKAARKQAISGWSFKYQVCKELDIDPSKVKSVTVSGETLGLAEITVVMYADYNAADVVKEEVSKYLLQERKQ